jgi:hypothetical protein
MEKQTMFVQGPDGGLGVTGIRKVLGRGWKEKGNLKRQGGWMRISKLGVITKPCSLQGA